jgi:L-fuculose-phosphate aldolase
MFEDVKYEVAVANRVLAELGLATGVLASLGHASLRVPEDPTKFVVKGRGYKLDALARMQPEDMVVCDLEGYRVEAAPGVTQCFEVKMHSCIYREHPEVQSIVHCHPRFTVIASILQSRLVPMCQEGAQLVRKPLPVYPHFITVQTEEQGAEVARLIGDSRAILLEGHGATTTGDSLEASVMAMYQLEEQARMNYYAACIAGPDHPGIREELLAEGNNRTPLPELPHFADSMRGERPRTGGVWAYYTDIAAGAMETE